MNDQLETDNHMHPKDFDEDPHNLLIPKHGPGVPTYVTILERGKGFILESGKIMMPIGVKILNLKDMNQYVWCKMKDGYLCVALVKKGEE